MAEEIVVVPVVVAEEMVVAASRQAVAEVPVMVEIVVASSHPAG